MIDTRLVIDRGVCLGFSSSAYSVIGPLTFEDTVSAIAHKLKWPVASLAL